MTPLFHATNGAQINLSLPQSVPKMIFFLFCSCIQLLTASDFRLLDRMPNLLLLLLLLLFCVFACSLSHYTYCFVIYEDYMHYIHSQHQQQVIFALRINRSSVSQNQPWYLTYSLFFFFFFSLLYVRSFCFLKYISLLIFILLMAMCRFIYNVLVYRIDDLDRTHVTIDLNHKNHMYIILK